MYTVLVCLSFCLGLLCMLMSSSLGLMLALIFLSIVLSAAIGVVYSIWFGLVTFLVYVGGLLVLFMYITMISSNFKFSLRTRKLVFLVFSLVFSGVTFYSGQYSLPDISSLGHVDNLTGVGLHPSSISVLVVILLLALLSIMKILTGSGKSVNPI